MILKLTSFLLLGSAILCCVSCAIPEPTPVEKKPAAVADGKVEARPAEIPAVMPPPTADAPGLPDDGIRMPDMLAMPTEAELRSTPKLEPAPGDTGAVVSRPPVNTPLEVKKTE